MPGVVFIVCIVITRSTNATPTTSTPAPTTPKCNPCSSTRGYAEYNDADEDGAYDADANY
jgi:hypothetical protein